MSARFRRGDVVTVRDVYAGRTKAAVSFITVEHTNERFVGWLPAGAQFALPVDASGVPAKDVMAHHDLAELTWAMPGSPGQLIVAPANALYSVIIRFFGDEWAVPEWYVNLQSPLELTDAGFDSTDYVVDLVVARDGSSWRWKDDDEFKKAEREGFVSPELSKTIRKTGEHALMLARAGTAPFDGEFLAFRPDPAWGTPRLDPRWRTLPV